MEEEKKEKQFVIKDKRIFDESGDLRNEEVNTKEKNSDEDTKIMPEDQEDNDKDSDRDEYYPDVNFANFVLSLSTSAMYHFGDFADPVTKKSEKNLPAAKQTIDILTMLRNKTAGNLDEGEKSLIEGILYELRMRYVKETGSQC